MKRSIVIFFCMSVMILTVVNASFATLITSGTFAGWDADPLSAVFISTDVATLPIQPYDDNVTSIYLTKHFTGVTALTFDINFIDGAQRDVPTASQGYIPNFLQVSFLSDSNVQTDFISYDKSGVYEPTTLNNVGAYGDWYSANITSFGGIDGTLYFILQDMGDQFSSQGLVRNVTVTENQANTPVPEPSTVILLCGGLGTLLLFRSRRMEIETRNTLR